MVKEVHRYDMMVFILNDWEQDYLQDILYCCEGGDTADTDCLRLALDFDSLKQESKSLPL